MTPKSDVYGFGVVLLEMLSGQRAIDKNRPTGQHNLVEWAKPYLTNKRRIFRVIDSRLEGQYSMDQAQKAASLSLQCIATEARARPTMDEVVMSLEQLQESKGARGAHKDRRSAGRRSSNAAPRSFRSSSTEEAPKVSAAAYPRPSASPLFAL